MKERVSDLALLGGEPAFTQALHVGRPHIGDRARLFARIDDLLDRRWLTNGGRFLEDLERRLADYIGVEHCVAVCNGTIGLQIAARALGLSGEVIVPSYTFVATAHALAWQGATPTFCDIDPATHNLDPALVEQLIGSRTQAVIAVHLWGRPCDVDGLAALTESHGLRLIFDAAHAFGCSCGGQMIGGFGDAEVFSFHATKVFNTFEGGAITTHDAELAQRARQLRNLGFRDYDDVAVLGTNGKMTEVAAAMGLTSLDALPDFIAANRENYTTYRAALAACPGISLLAQDERQDLRNYHHVVIEIDEAAAGLSRDALQRVLWPENILARRYFYPGIHRMQPYRSAQPALHLPVTEDIARRTLVLPSGGGLEPGDVEVVCETIRFVLDHSDELRTRPASVE